MASTNTQSEKTKDSPILMRLGYALIIFGLVDYFGFIIFGIDLTGVFWSPIAAGVAGGLLIAAAQRDKSKAASVIAGAVISNQGIAAESEELSDQGGN